MLLPIEDVVRLSIEKMKRNHVPQQEAEIAASIFLEGELWGKPTHGIRYMAHNLTHYQQASKLRRVMSIERETPVSALLDGGYHFPVFVHHTAMKLAIKKAQVSGLAMVGTIHAGTSGLLGYYSQLATEAGLIGVAINTTPPSVVPPQGIVPLLGTNPLTIGIPRTGHPPLILDMATSSMTYNALLKAQREKTFLPAGVVQDQHGNPTTDPFAAIDETSSRSLILPFAEHKGFGLSFMIELLCGAGLHAPIGKDKVNPQRLDAEHGNGIYLAYRPDLFVEQDVFEAQVAQLVADIKAEHKADTHDEIRLPGEHSQRVKQEILRSNHIEIEDATYKYLLT
jgi:L-2-hydroxycarboxylate dehydrogenase (NAD+)